MKIFLIDRSYITSSSNKLCDNFFEFEFRFMIPGIVTSDPTIKSGGINYHKSSFNLVFFYKQNDKLPLVSQGGPRSLGDPYLNFYWTNYEVSLVILWDIYPTYF